MSVSDNTPILIGVGQTKSDWTPADAAKAPSPLSLAAVACKAAIEDCGASDESALRKAIDTIAIARTMADSVPMIPPPFGRCDNLPRAVAARIGISPTQAMYSAVGGDTPQSLVGEFAEKIHNGSCKAVLLGGAEAIAAMKAAQRADMKLDWNESVEGQLEDRVPQQMLATEYELANGIGLPTHVYALFENAYRKRCGRTIAEHRRVMSELFAGFSKVAAGNPYAQYPTERSAEFLETVSDANYEIATPYLKWHVAQASVNQGAALVLTSVGEARRLSVPESKWVYLHGYAKAVDPSLSRRADLSRSPAMEKAVALALSSAGKTVEELAHVDLYSCFPVAVLIAAEALGLDWRARTPTITGGLPFFGGAGNNYSMHAIASMAERLRAAPGTFGLVLANGGFLTKEAVGVYSTTPAENWTPVSSAGIQAELDRGEGPEPIAKSGKAKLTTYTVVYKKGEPVYAVAIADMGNERIVAKTRRGDTELPAAMAATDCMGAEIEIAAEEKANYVESIATA